MIYIIYNNIKVTDHYYYNIMTQKNIIIDNKIFKTKQELKIYVKHLLLTKGLGTISNNDVDFIFFKELLLRNPKYGDLNSIVGFEIRYDPLSGSNNKLYYIDSDKNYNLFSWNKCIVGKSSTTHNKLMDAYRSSVQPQITLFKKITKPICNECGKDAMLCEVDHTIDFIQLIKNFNEVNNNYIIPTEFVKNEFGINCFMEKDINVMTKWGDFHQKNAILQMLCHKCHKYKTKLR